MGCCLTIPETNRLSLPEAFPIFLPVIGSFRQVRAWNSEKGVSSAVLNLGRNEREIPVRTIFHFHLKTVRGRGRGDGSVGKTLAVQPGFAIFGSPEPHKHWTQQQDFL